MIPASGSVTRRQVETDSGYGSQYSDGPEAVHQLAVDVLVAAAEGDATTVARAIRLAELVLRSSGAKRLEHIP